jgi:Gpi18-like mannosyltransferase
VPTTPPNLPGLFATVLDRARSAAAPAEGRPDGYFDLSRRLGGRIGRHAAKARAGGLNLWVFGLATLTWLITMVRQLPCRNDDASKGVDMYAPMCYSDINILYRLRGFAEGQRPYLDFDWEYPVLTGVFTDVARRITDFLGFKGEIDLDHQAILDNANVYFAVTAVGLFACFLGVVAVQRRLMGAHPWGVAAVAAAPAVMTTGLINWDLFAVLLCSLGLLAYTRDQPVRAGLWFGLAIAAKLYPVVILGGLFVLCWRGRKLVPYARLLIAAVAAWFVVNLPFMIAAPQAWAHFYTYNQARPPDLGSLWLSLDLVGLGPSTPQSVALFLMIAGYAGIAVLTRFARTPPRVGQIAFLCVGVMVTLNLVYSPQYVLWVLPLIVWARPVWRDLVAWVAAELLYFAAVWLYLGNPPASDAGPPKLYVIAIFLRVAVTWWVMARVVRDIQRPAGDPLAAERDLAPELRAELGLGSAAADAAAPASRRGAEPLFPPALAASGAILAWVFSRLILTLTAVVIGSSKGLGGLDAMRRWDADRLIRIAEAGYPLDDLTQAASFPGLPLLMKVFHLVGLPYVVGGFLISLAASGLAAWALYRLARGGVAGAVAVAAWSLAPMAVFSIVPYSESLFLAFALWAWVKARDDHWGWAALLAAGACATRVSGLFLIVALALLAVWGYGPVVWRRLDWGRVRRRLAWLSPAVGVVFAYVVYLRFHYGSWSAWYDAQRHGWARSFHWPWEGLRTTLCAAHWDSSCSAGYDAVNAPIFSAEIIAVLVGGLLTLVLLWRRRYPEGGWVGLQVAAMSCQIWFMSVARAVILWFPLWTLLGRAAAAPLRGAAWRWRVVAALAGLAVSILLMVAWAARFYGGAWSG